MARRKLIQIEPPESEWVEITTGGPKKVFRKRKFRRPFARLGKYRYEELNIDWFKPIIEELRMARYQHRLSQRQLAGLVGTNQSEISQFETGKSNPTVEFVDRLAKALDVKIKVLFK